MQTLPTEGAASREICELVTTQWMEAAQQAGIDLSAFDPCAPLSERLAWARGLGLEIGSALTRFSFKDSSSTTAQVTTIVRFAPSKRIYVPPEYVCVDEAITGRKRARAGVERVKLILANKLCDVLLVYKMSRLFRSSYQGTQFINEEVVEEDLRAISVTQQIDTNDEKSWKPQVAMYGIMDEMLIGAIGDHVRSGLQDLFRQGYVTGAVPVGYKTEVVPNAPKTKRGLPRMRRAIDPEAAALIKQHFTWLSQGMPLREGWRRWLAANGPSDPRSPTGRTTYGAYRRMVTNEAYTGRFAYGEKRNQWKSKRDYNVQVDGPKDEVIRMHWEHLRIVDDDLFYSVQKIIAAKCTSNRGRSKPAKVKQLEDLVVDLFYCAQCDVRFYQTGVNGKSMYCGRDVACPCKCVLRRGEAVTAVCNELAALLESNARLFGDIILKAIELDAVGDTDLHGRLASVEQRLAHIDRRIEDLIDMAGSGSEEERQMLKGKVKAAQQERATILMDRASLQKAAARKTTPIGPERVREILKDFAALLRDAACGVLGDDCIYLAVDLFRTLVGGRIDVYVERRAGRKRTNVFGTFTPEVLQALSRSLDVDHLPVAACNQPVKVWLREPPRQDRLAERVHKLIDEEGHSYRSAARVLQSEGHKLNSGSVWQIYRRYYEMIGQPLPDLPYNNGRDRDSAA